MKRLIFFRRSGLKNLLKPKILGATRRCIVVHTVFFSLYWGLKFDFSEATWIARPGNIWAQPFTFEVDNLKNKTFHEVIAAVRLEYIRHAVQANAQNRNKKAGKLAAVAPFLFL